MDEEKIVDNWLEKLTHVVNIEDAPTLFTQTEFKKYVPLFQKNTTLNKQELDVLSFEYFDIVNMYYPVHIVSDFDRTKVLLKLPRLFTETAIEINDKESLLSDKLTNSSNTNRPDFKHKVFNEYYNNFLSGQNNSKELLDNIISNKDETTDIMENLFSLYSDGDETNAESNSDLPSDIDWVMDE